MTISRILRHHFTKTLFTFFIVLQLSACGSDDGLSADTTSIEPNNITSEPNTENTPFFSGTDGGSLIKNNTPNNNLLEINGRLFVSNVGSNTHFIANAITGKYGNLAIDIHGNWGYTADNAQSSIQSLASNETLVDTLTVSIASGASHAITITIIGTDKSGLATPSVNQPALISGINTGTVIEDVDPNNNNLLEVGAKLNITDNNIGEAAFIANNITGRYGNLVINTNGNWNYTAVNSQSAIQNLASGNSITDTLTVSSIDGTTHTITVTILGANKKITTANVLLSWIAPAARDDNSALSLSAIAGYKIYYSTTPGQYSNSTTINDGSATNYTFNNLVSNTYYFVVTTIDTNGRESQYSSQATISI